ncbi:hypothetical protein FOA52_011707 [Chlamydomonas sp. UWO 241]|nr:hypothetical protein FOA52_011707 [Chlamydomonas sp. UWO 241]
MCRQTLRCACMHAVQAGIDYAPLRIALAAGDWRAADDATRAALIQLAGNGALKRGYVNASEVGGMPAQDLIVLDTLWRAASGGKFGYSVQRELFTRAGRRWVRFFKLLDWVTGSANTYRKWPTEFIYSLEAARGHLPLTNTLRGSHLITAILEHPAFGGPAGARAPIGEESVGQQAQGIRELL